MPTSSILIQWIYNSSSRCAIDYSIVNTPPVMEEKASAPNKLAKMDAANERIASIS